MGITLLINGHKIFAVRKRELSKSPDESNLGELIYLVILLLQVICSGYSRPLVAPSAVDFPPNIIQDQIAPSHPTNLRQYECSFASRGTEEKHFSKRGVRVVLQSTRVRNCKGSDSQYKRNLTEVFNFIALPRHENRTTQAQQGSQNTQSEVVKISSSSHN